MMKTNLFIIFSLCFVLSSCENMNTTNPDGRPGREQAENDQDRDITQKVRQALVNDDSLSTNAKNVKVSTNDGAVTLQGKVDSDQEKETVAKRAKAVSGVRNVVNQLEVTGS